MLLLVLVAVVLRTPLLSKSWILLAEDPHGGPRREVPSDRLHLHGQLRTDALRLWLSMKRSVKRFEVEKG